MTKCTLKFGVQANDTLDIIQTSFNGWSLTTDYSMLLDGTSSVNWLQLSPELWGHIFLCLKPCQKDVLAGGGFRNSHTATFYRLNEVCKTFHQVFQTHSQLHTTVYLGPETEGSSSVSLFKWLCRHRSSIQNLIAAFDSTWLEAVLALLIDAPVTTIYLAHVRAPALAILTQFKFVTTCVITGSKDANFGLALGAFTNLTSLRLEDGAFQDFESAVNLTSLTLQECVATCSKACDCVTSLLELQLVGSSLYLYQQGLCAFSCLQYLRCVGGLVVGNTDADSLWLNKVPNLPLDLSVLTALTKLDLQIAPGDGTGRIKLDWLTMLLGLKSLSASLFATEVELPKAFSLMVHLTNLELLCRTVDDDPSTALRVDLDLSSLVSLESLTLSSPVIDNSWGGLNGLISLKKLKHIKYSCKPSAETIQDLIELSLKIGSVRPDMCIEYISHVD